MFIVRPHPLPNESLSSWRQRSGAANGFRRFPLPNNLRSSADPDRSPNAQEQIWLAENFALPLEELPPLFLETRLVAIQKRDIFSPKLRWATAFGAKARPSPHGPTCCPACLRNDPIPYFRIHWRYAFLTDCPIHATELIDCCPRCSKPLWPIAIFQLPEKKHWDGLSHCPSCSFDLRLTEGKITSVLSSSADLWEAMCADRIPEQFHHCQNLADWFDGIWVLSQMVLRKNCQPILSNIPAELFGGLDNLPVSSPLVEILSLEARRSLINIAIWLMGEWPTRFVDVARRSGLSRTHFSPTAAVNPNWLTECINQHLALHKRSVTPSQVNEAIDSLKDAGHPITKSAVRDLLGVAESKAVDDVLSRREHARYDELLILLRKFEKLIAEAPDSRDQRATAIRDYLIILLTILCQSDVENICDMEISSINRVLTTSIEGITEDDASTKLIRTRTTEIKHLYETLVRPKFIDPDNKSSHWFLGRQGENLAGHTVRARISAMMKNGFPIDLWKSVDVFQYVLGTPPLGRRTLRRLMR